MVLKPPNVLGFLGLIYKIYFMGSRCGKRETSVRGKNIFSVGEFFFRFFFFKVLPLD